MGYLQTLPSEFLITIANGDVWRTIGLALLLGGGCWAFGIWVSRTVGLLERDAPAGETLGVGLASGLMVLAAWWAALRSGGQSSFTPVAIGFAIAIGLAMARRARHPAAHDTSASEAADGNGDTTGRRWTQRRSLLPTALAAGLFVVAIALLYGSTLALSPRDGVQPVEKIDVAFYTVLGRDLATTGIETNTLPSGFSDLPGDSPQTWYHWGELWLASAVISIFGTAPLAARHFVVLPLVLLAAAALTGTIVRRMSGRTSRLAFVYGFFACLILAPMPLILGPFFSAWPVGLIVGIVVFGLAAVAVLFALYALAVLGELRPTWPLSVFVGSAVALILPAHIVIAVLGLVGVVSVWAVRIGRSLVATHRLPTVPEIWLRTVAATAIAFTSTVVWGLFTDHGLGGGAPLDIVPFNDSWRHSIGIVALQAGMLLTPLVIWPLLWRRAPTLAELCLGTTAIVVFGAIAWGWRLPTFNMFYFFFGGIAVIATPVAAVVVWLLLERVRSAGHRRLAIALVTLCVIQLELDAVLALGRLQSGTSAYAPIPVSLLHAIERLPSDAKVAYACQPLEEISFVNSKLIGIDAHTGRRVVPMCFQADALGPLFGAERSRQRPDAGFLSAPQRVLFPDSTARPSSQAVADFLRAHDIDYIYADAIHPNTLVADAVPVATESGFALLRVP